jgi:hypothetical protein
MSAVPTGATQLITGSQDRRATPLFEGILLVSSLALTGMSLWGRRHRELLAGHPDVEPLATGAVPIAASVVLLVSLALAVLVPAVGAYPLFALLITDRLDRAWLRAQWRWAHRHPPG